MGRSLHPGDLKQFVTIQRRATVERGETGQPETGWQDVESRSCRIENLSAAVVFSAATTTARVSVKVTFRRDELTETLAPLSHRLRDEDAPERIWNVTDVRPHPDREYVDVFAALEVT